MYNRDRNSYNNSKKKREEEGYWNGGRQHGNSQGGRVEYRSDRRRYDEGFSAGNDIRHANEKLYDVYTDEKLMHQPIELDIANNTVHHQHNKRVYYKMMDHEEAERNRIKQLKEIIKKQAHQVKEKEGTREEENKSDEVDDYKMMEDKKKKWNTDDDDYDC